MANASDDKVRHPTIHIYFNASNSPIYEELLATVDRGQLSVWIIEAIQMRLRHQSLIGLMEKYLLANALKPLPGGFSLTDNTAAPPLADDFADWDG